MRLSLNIISEITDINGISPEDIASRLTMSTAEIETIHYMNQHFKTIFTAKILDVARHPDADKLTLVDLDAGTEKLRVVCGAPNHKKGDFVPLAKIGTKFSEDFEIKKSKIRGQESSGMLCSKRELGFSDDHSGILIFPENTPIGKPLSEIFPDWVDIVFEIDNKSITNRPDLWGHVGIAREIGALFGRPVKNIVNEALESEFKNTDTLKVTIKCPEETPRYSGLVMKNIKIAESPEWMKARITALGMRPISNIVDVTNYVMMEIGEPMHAFDRKKLGSNEIVVRMAEEGEKLTTLDDQERILSSEDIVITDGKTATALAGIMGGANSDIDNNTTEIVLEAANFRDVNIRKSAHRHNLPSDACLRFEKSQSPEITRSALLRCYELIKQIIPGAEAVTNIVDCYPVKLKEIEIKTTCEYITRNLGQSIPDEKIIEILRSLDFKVESAKGTLTIKVPHYRATKDISIPADIVEEVGRIYGFDNIHASAPMIQCAVPDVNEIRTFERTVKAILSKDFNMTEVSSYSYLGEDILNKTGINEDKELRLQNPISLDLDRLRRSLVPNMLKMIKDNQRYNDSFAIYELGRVYKKDNRKSKDLINEERWVCGAYYRKKSDDTLFYFAKKAAQGLLGRLNLKSLRTEPCRNPEPYMHPGRSLSVIVEGAIAGQVFEVNPKILKNFDITGKLSMFEINISPVFKAKKTDVLFKELPKFPDVPFEISVIADKYAYAADIEKVIQKSGKEFIKSIEVISVYEGAPIADGMKSVSYKIVFAAKDATLSPEQIDSLQKGVIEALNKNGYKLR